MSLVELMVTMLIMGLVAGVVVGAVVWANKTTTSQSRNAALWADMQDASAQMVRDVNDASQITVADANSLTALVVRGDKCQERAWSADPVADRLTVTTSFYEQADCSGPSSSSAKTLIGNNALGTNTAGSHPSQYLPATTFAFYDTPTGAALPVAGIEVDRITRVEWTLTARADVGYRTQKISSGAAFTGKGAVSTGSGAVTNAKMPLLCLSLRLAAAVPAGMCDTQPIPAAAVGKLEGRDDPVLQWVDASPTLTQGWTIFRITNPEGAPVGTPGTWTYLMALPAAQTSYTDLTVPDGYNAQYVIRANTPSGAGPKSNTVVSGLRPVAPVVTAAGATTSIKVSWPNIAGAGAFDVYRDGLLVANLADVDDWTDGPGQPGWTGDGYGHTHFYKVVSVNRWESRLISGSESARVPVGTAVGTVYPGGARPISTQTATSGDYTAPDVPTFTVTPTDTWSNWIDPSLKGWTGAGPTGVTRGWETQQHATAGAWTNLWTGAGEVPASTSSKEHTGRGRGDYDYYQVRSCNLSGCSPYAATKYGLQRPPTPTCSIGGVDTRSMDVTVNPAASESANRNFDLAGGIGSPTGTGTKSSKVFNIDHLTHNRLNTWTVMVQNDSPAHDGWSNSNACSTATLLLDVTLGGWSNSTRSVVVGTSSRVNGGAVSNVTLQGSETHAGLGGYTFDPLRDGTGFTLTAYNSDGWQAVTDSRAVFTDVLPTPGAPATPDCSYAATDGVAQGSYTIAGVSGAAVYVGGQSRSGLGEGSYRGAVYRNGSTNTDGYNSNTGPDSGTDYCSWLTVIIPAPATPSAGLSFSSTRNCAPAAGFTVGASWSSVAYATSYNVQMTYLTSSGSASQSTTTGGTGAVFSVADINAVFGTASVSVQAVGPGGSSGWSPAQGAVTTGGCNAV